MIQLTKPVLVAIAAGVIAVCSIAVAAWRLSSVSEAPSPVVQGPASGQSAAPTPTAPAPGSLYQSANPTNVSPASAAPGGAAVVASQDQPGNAAPAASPLAVLTTPSVSSPASSPSASSPKPSFDVVRIDPTGDAVVAGRAAPRAQVALMLSGKPVAQAQANDDGQFVMLPPSLPPGDHVLALRATGADGEIVSEQTVSIAVPQRGGQPAVAALTEANKPTVVLSQPAAGAASGSALRIVSVEALQGGSMFASGFAPPGATLRLYLNESYIASVEAGADGKWSIRVERGMSAGSYRVRADRIGPDGKTVSRVEAPFDYPAELARQVAAAGAVASGSQGGESAAPVAVAQQSLGQGATPGGPTTREPSSTAAASGALAQTAPQGSTAGGPRSGDAQNAVVSELRTARVQRGDSLWRISTTVYGEGTRYTQIYDANASQIRDPDLIYPGQILVVPKQDAPKPAGPGERRR